MACAAPGSCETDAPGFSPLREGDTSVAVQVLAIEYPAFSFQSPSRGGHLRGTSHPARLAPLTSHVSVPFARGTPPWLRAVDADTALPLFGFSPLREGDTSVAR